MCKYYESLDVGLDYCSKNEEFMSYPYGETNTTCEYCIEHGLYEEDFEEVNNDA